ncbi:MAG: hypothetical protein CMJ75_10570 [Planctomycetaceae bacterium]|nr:hypothetical protein [Planctomycetaceae bacterium]
MHVLPVKWCRQKLPDGLVRLVGMAAAKRSVGNVPATQTATIQIILGKTYSAQEIAHHATVDVS